MEHTRFDGLARFAATRRSRRQVLHGLGGELIANALTAVGRSEWVEAAGAGGSQCTSPPLGFPQCAIVHGTGNGYLCARLCPWRILPRPALSPIRKDRNDGQSSDRPH